MIKTLGSSVLLIPATVVMNIAGGSSGMLGLLTGAVLGLVIGYVMRGDENAAILAQRERRDALTATPDPARATPIRREIAA